MLERLRQSPVLVLLPPVLLFVAGMTWADWAGVAVLPAAGAFGALALAAGVALGTLAGPYALVMFYLTVLCAASLATWIGLGAAVGLSDIAGFWVAAGLVFTAGMAASFVRSPLRHRFVGRVIIDRPRREVWDALYLQPTTRHWKPHVRKVEAVPGHSDHFNQYYRTGSHEDDDMPPVMIKRSDVTEGSCFTLETVPTPEQNMMRGVSDRQKYTLEDAGAGTRVTTVEILQNARLGMLIMSALIKPCQDELRQLKAILEGADDTTFASAFYRGDDQ